MAPRSEETKRKISEKAKARWADPEFKARVSKKIGASAKEVWKRPGYKEKMSKSLKGVRSGENNPMYGKRHSEETRAKMRDSHNDWQVGEKHPMYGKKHSEASRAKMRDSHNDWQAGELHPMYGVKHSQESRAKMSKSHTGVPLPEETKANISKASQRMWDNMSEEKKDEWMKKVSASRFCSPNKPESEILSILNRLYPDEWKFVGDGQVVIAGKCPDFINVNGQKKIIELYGDYWHRGQNPEDRINIFKPYGYKTLVVWEHELKKPDVVVRRIVSFCEG